MKTKGGQGKGGKGSNERRRIYTRKRRKRKEIKENGRRGSKSVTINKGSQEKGSD